MDSINIYKYFPIIWFLNLICYCHYFIINIIFNRAILECHSNIKCRLSHVVFTLMNINIKCVIYVIYSDVLMGEYFNNKYKYTNNKSKCMHTNHQGFLLHSFVGQIIKHFIIPLYNQWWLFLNNIKLSLF